MKKVSLIVAKSNNNVIGNDNKLLWSLPTDMKFFKETTTSYRYLIMGRKTFESIGKALPNRKSIIITRDKSFNFEDKDVIIVHSLEDAIKSIPQYNDGIIIGGGEIYNEAITKNLVNTLYVTHVDCDVEGDTLFPVLDEEKWLSVNTDSYLKDEKHDFNFNIKKYRGL